MAEGSVYTRVNWRWWIVLYYATYIYLVAASGIMAVGGIIIPAIGGPFRPLAGSGYHVTVTRSLSEMPRSVSANEQYMTGS